MLQLSEHFGTFWKYVWNYPTTLTSNSISNRAVWKMLETCVAPLMAGVFAGHGPLQNHLSWRHGQVKFSGYVLYHVPHGSQLEIWPNRELS